MAQRVRMNPALNAGLVGQPPHRCLTYDCVSVRPSSAQKTDLAARRRLRRREAPPLTYVKKIRTRAGDQAGAVSCAGTAAAVIRCSTNQSRAAPDEISNPGPT